MSITTTNGMVILDDLDSRPNGPGIIQQLGNQVDAFYGGKVANAAALPASGDFDGQRVWLIDVKGYAVWNGAAWISDTALLNNVTWASGWSTYAPEATEYERRNGVVTIYVGVTRPDAHAAESPVLTMPAGFRPRRAIRATGQNNGSLRPFTVLPTGVLRADAAQAAGQALFVGSISYPAASA